MRPILALLVATTILGGLRLYMELRPTRTATFAQEPETLAAGRFALEITLSFAAGPDPFALDLDQAPSLLVLFRGAELLRVSEPVDAGIPVRREDLPQIAAGANEFFVRATPQDPDPRTARAVRLRLLRDEQPIAEQSLWSLSGEVVEGAVVLRVPNKPVESAEAPSASVPSTEENQ